MREYRHFHVLMTVLFATMLGLAPAEEPAKAESPGRLKLATERVVIFKDGFALFVKNATATADAQGRVYTAEVPDGAILGCFWASSDGKALTMRAEWDEDREERATETACITTVELLRANKGKKVVLGLTREKAPDVAGTIAEVLDLPPEKEKRPAEGRGPRPVQRLVWRQGQYMAQQEELPEASAEQPLERVRELTPRGGELVAVDTEGGRVVLPVGEIRTVSGAEVSIKMVRREEVVRHNKRLSFELGADAAGKPAALKLMYFAEGVRWIPTYRIAGALVDKAEIALQGEVVNEAEDIEGAAVDLVVGVPNFRFKHVVSPLSLERNLRQALLASNPSLMRNDQLSNGQFMQRAGEWRGREAAVAPDAGALNLAPELAAGGHQDLFVYSAKTLNLKKGARATLPLWQSAAPLRHIYTLDVKFARDARSGGYGKQAQYADQGMGVSPLKLDQQQVWHQYELANTGNMPWTTGAALILKDQLPLGQELLTYTAPGVKSLLPVTVAVDMTGSYQEEELARQPNALNWSGTQFAQIRKKASITVANNRKEKSLTRVCIGIGGKADKASDGGVVKIDDHRNEDWQNGGYAAVNNHSDVTWELELEPGQTKTLTFEVAMYIH